MNDHLDACRVNWRIGLRRIVSINLYSFVYQTARLVVGLFLVLSIITSLATLAADPLRIKVVLEGIDGDMRENVQALLSLEQFNIQKDLKEQLRALTSLQVGPKSSSLTVEELASLVDLGVSEILNALAPFG